MRKYRTDDRLWGLISGSILLTIAVAWANLEGFRTVTFLDLAAVLIACALLGWVFQALAVMCGVRLSGSIESLEALDYYDDSPLSK